MMSFFPCIISWLGFPDGASGKEPDCQCRRHKRYGFDPWVGKMPWRRKWQPSAVFFPGESHGQRSLKGYNPQGRQELDTTEATEHAHTLLFCKGDGTHVVSHLGYRGGRPESGNMKFLSRKTQELSNLPVPLGCWRQQDPISSPTYSVRWMA